jgi:hypothetical protein
MKSGADEVGIFYNLDKLHKHLYTSKKTNSIWSVSFKLKIPFLQ